MIIEAGWEAVEVCKTIGRSAFRPWITPKRFTSIILWK